VTPATAQEVRFAGMVRVGRTYPRGEYERGAATTWNLSSKKVEKIRQEINTFKRQMPVHEESKMYTHFYK
jgi:protein BNI4